MEPDRNLNIRGRTKDVLKLDNGIAVTAIG